MSDRAVDGREDQGALAVQRLMRPRSVAIIGVSAKPGSAGHTMLANLTVNNYLGEVHLVGRSGGDFGGRKVLTAIDDLPESIDLAIFTLPAAAVKESVTSAVRRKVKTGVIFAAGFAEMGERERSEQEAITAIANEGGLRLLGPNCLGYTNYVDRFAVGFASARPIPKMEARDRPTVAIVSQSGGLTGHLQSAYEVRNLKVTYTISTGNEADLGLEDFIDFLADDEATRCIAIYVEDIPRPADFLRVTAKAREHAKPLIMMHPGRSADAQHATRSHTGALAVDHAVMKMHVERAGVVFVETLEELVDVAELLAHFPAPPVKGAGILTFSGAFCAIAHDYCKRLGLDIPPLSPKTESILKKRLPVFATPRNPLDLTTQPIWEPDLMEVGAKALLDDPNIGSLTISIPAGNPKLSAIYLKGLASAMKGISKPVTVSVLGDGASLPAEFLAVVDEQGIILSRSSERALRATARITEYGRASSIARADSAPIPFTGLPEFRDGALPEWSGKRLLATIGLSVPAGELASTLDEGVRVAARVGYPVALKAQAEALQHKTDAGGVLLNIADETALRQAWAVLAANVARFKPGLVLDGVLVEAIAARGLEMMVGGKRDPKWGPVIVVGLGGVWVEALGDVRLVPPDLPESSIVDEIMKLKASKLLKGFRGFPAADVKAVAHTAATIGRLMMTQPEIAEIDINPLVVFAEGAMALDALIVIDRT
jgi:acetate---CoA ligase (ADP-forming)